MPKHKRKNNSRSGQSRTSRTRLSPVEDFQQKQRTASYASRGTSPHSDHAPHLLPDTPDSSSSPTAPSAITLFVQGMDNLLQALTIQRSRLTLQRISSQPQDDGLTGLQSSTDDAEKRVLFHAMYGGTPPAPGSIVVHDAETRVLTSLPQPPGIVQTDPESKTVISDDLIEQIEELSKQMAPFDTDPEIVSGHDNGPDGKPTDTIIMRVTLPEIIALIGMSSNMLRQLGERYDHLDQDTIPDDISPNLYKYYSLYHKAMTLQDRLGRHLAKRRDHEKGL